MRFALTILPLTVLALGCGGSNKNGSAPQPGVEAEREEGKVPLVRIAELEIDPTQLAAYTAAVREEMDASVRVEPGVLAIYCVAEKDHPSKLRFFEMYADEAAYRAHIESAHFKKYVETTKSMTVSRKLIEAVPVQLSVKPS